MLLDSFVLPSMRFIEVDVWSDGDDAMRFALTLHGIVYTDFTLEIIDKIPGSHAQCDID